MRGKRSKQYRKLMQAYAMSFDFREPYQVLVDAEIIKDAARYKMKLGSMLENTLHGQIKPMITQCCIRHLYDAEVELSEKSNKEQWIEVAKQAERRRCGHHELETPLSALECIESVLDPKGNGTNKHRYVVATQEQEVREALRMKAGVPLVYINRSVMILEPLAARSAKVRNQEEVSKRKSGLIGRRNLVVGGKRDREDDGEEEADGTVVKKRKKQRGPKEPNPLSIKKSKSKVVDASLNGKGHGTKAKTGNSLDHRHEATPANLANGDLVETEQPAAKRKRRRKPKTIDETTSEKVAMADDDDAS